MKTYRIKLKVKTGSLTPFQADTLFGHICWVIAYKEGEKVLQEFLQPFKDGKPPFVFSDGFPSDYLPKPLSAEFIASENDRKDIRKTDYLSPDDFNKAIAGKPIKPLAVSDKAISKTVSTHNTINRLTNTTGEEGGVYSLPETVIPEVSVYLKVTSDEWKDKVFNWLKDLSNTGYGRKKSIGKGQFTVERIEEYNFPAVNKANGFVTLSNFSPAETDPVEGLYKTFVKYGKLGEEFTFCGNPFKKPLLMIKTGSAFKTNSQPEDYYGRVAEEIAPAKNEVVQYAYGFAVALKYPKE